MFKIPSSFRDPSGFVFMSENEIYRNIDISYSRHYKSLVSSGLLEKLFTNELLVLHSEASSSKAYPTSFMVIKPEKLPLISYPYEWSFSQLKDAALLTLDVMQLALQHGMILKDASAFNVQFKGHKPIFIDTLSFEIYEEGQSWKGYRQFCEHFLAPLFLCSTFGSSYQALLKLGVNGIPLKMASGILPVKTWLNTGALFHIHLHARTIAYYGHSNNSKTTKLKKISRQNLDSLVTHLRECVERLNLHKNDKTQWQNYHQETHYSEEGKQSKIAIVQKFVNVINPTTVWDVGANDGVFSRAVVGAGRSIISLDADQMAVENNYRGIRQQKIDSIYPLIYDVTNPSADIGWANQERTRLISRSQPEVVMALAIIHHLVISNNVPFHNVAEYFANIAPWLIIEFVPKEDQKIEALENTAGKSLYSRAGFESGFFSFFDLVRESSVQNSQRTILLLKRK